MTLAAAPGAPASPGDVADAVAEAAATRTALRVVGRGEWLDAGRPVRAARELPLAGLSGVVEYTPGDLTLTALAGTPLSAIAAAAGAEGQFLALDPPGSDGGSIGATVATASAGPLAHAFGLPRDNVLGVEFVTGAGARVRGGGRVVKNVAGFDLTRLVTGAWGTLGVLTEITVRLRALPEADATVAVAVPATGTPGWLARVRALPVAAYALELVNAPLARALGLSRDAVLLARLAGNEPSVRAQREALLSLGDTADVPPAVWDALRAADRPGTPVVRLSAPVGEVAAAWQAALRLAETAAPHAGLVHATVGRGVARCLLAGAAADALGAALRAVPRERVRIFERLPAALWAGHAPSAADDPLARRVRAAFDPHRVLNPGVLGETPDD